jgi:formylglycine-generating enzyme required for sulfatase activity
MALRKVEAGKFTMGSPSDELGRDDDEVQHEVTLTKDFYIAVFQTTQKQYETIAGSYPSYFSGDIRPVECVSYNMIRGEEKGAGWPANSDVDEESFLGKLRAKTSKDFDLPTEAQWEYACRARTTTALNDGNNLTNRYEDGNMNKLGRYSYNGGENEGTAAVGSYLPNKWGLYDMHGNVCEWCLDWYGSYEGDATDPKGATEGSYRIYRGGSYDSSGAYRCRSAFRNGREPSGDGDDYGFRVVLIP